MTVDLNKRIEFQSRHIGPGEKERQLMLDSIGVSTLDELIEQTIPDKIRLSSKLNLPKPVNEFRFLQSFKEITTKNKVYNSFLGMGYYGCVVPLVIQRNILENPGWYTAYTPYQAEIAQGRLEALVNFQTMVSDLTGMEIANASLLDEGTAAAEAMSMLYSLRKKEKKSANKYFIDQNIFPQTLSVLTTRAKPMGIELEVGDLSKINLSDSELFGLFVQYPNSDGAVCDHSELIKNAKANNIAVTVAADLLSLTLLTPPGEMGADVVVGTTQRLGVPRGFGGPHAAYFATSDTNKRQIPGRVIGVSIDANGNKAYRMALQTREQHIRREKATSNICTAQVLLAVIAGMYAVYHGPQGLKQIASRIHGLAKLTTDALAELGFAQLNDVFFDTIKIQLESEVQKQQLHKIAESKEINLRYFENQCVGISFDEIHEVKDALDIIEIFEALSGNNISKDNIAKKAETIEISFPSSIARKSDFLTHAVFQNFHSEHELLRYLKRLENKDLSLTHSMISLGSCTMKLNATAEMIPITWPELSFMHPFAPIDQTQGYMEMIAQLSEWLSEITGFHSTSLQPNSGAQGEYAGLMVIKAYHESRGEGHRNITIIPSSAHGTNPASAVMAGNAVIITACDEFGNIDVEDLRNKAIEYKDNLSSLMVTYPSTHGVFEESIIEICNIIHENGGQVYMDGANMNAQVGLTSPAMIGADVCHLNLHKTFCIPHGGGGPGVGPIGVAEHLSPFLPGNPVIKSGGNQAISAISSAPYGSAGILAIPYAYIAMMGAEGLTNATKTAILNANYLKSRLEGEFKILYSGKNGRCAHEMIVDCREFKSVGIEVEDIAKRLMDYGYHAPTVSFPVAGTLMIEPTESETKEEIDRFCDTLLNIKAEIDEVARGEYDASNNVLKNAPHTSTVAISDNWDYPYKREKAIYPLPFVRANKFWPSVGRVDNAYGDRNLYCSCIPVEDYQEKELV
ncbi:aminomethyl-transferring glycine dehydrogenase [Reichenbachiella sp. MALMAid0571]|uniref:aminomethyl-transferring glycine dehydrogenase n=1 Tax=Reichenbachiella sp. MALMAid0571 TaxID=3143939 RepID=UPI0032DE4C1E